MPMSRIVLAFAFLLVSCLTGLALVVPPEVLNADEQQSLSSPQASNFFQSPEHLIQPVLCDEPPCPPTALDEVKEFLHRGYQKTADSLEGAKGFVNDRMKAAKGSAEDANKRVKDGIHDAADRTEDAIHETAKKAGRAVDTTAEKTLSFMKNDKDAHRKVQPDPALYIMPGVSKSIDNLQKTFVEERDQIISLVKDSPTMDELKKKLEGASSFGLGVLHIGDSIGNLKKGIQETVKGGQEKASHVLESASGMVCYARDKAGNLICAAREKLFPHTHIKDDATGLEAKVQELCSVYGANQGARKSGGARVEDTVVLHESYAYLMESALQAIDDAKEIFEKAIGGGGIEYREKYLYLVDSAKGALEGASHAFVRAVATIEDEHVRDNDKHLTARLKDAATHTKHRLSSMSHLLLRTSYLASFAMAFGVTLWTTFFSGHVLAHCLPRQQFALVQSKLFPLYLNVIRGCLLICTLGYAVLHPWLSASWGERLQIMNFTASLAVSLCSMFVLEPKVTKVVFEKLRVEREGRGHSGDSGNGAALDHLMSVDTRFKTLHQTASLANLLIIAGLAWHLWYLSSHVSVV